MKLNLPWFSSKKNPVGGMIPVSPGQPKYTPRDYKHLSDEGYVKNNVVFSAVNLVATSCSQVEFKIKQGGEYVEEHPILDLLDNPNPLNGKSEFITAAVAYRLLAGNSYINAVGSAESQDGTQPTYNWIPRELWVNRPDRFKVIEGKNTPVGAYEYSVGGRCKRFPVDQITGQSNLLHWKTFHPTNDYYGLSAIEAAAVGIDIYNQSMDWNKAFFDNGARPSGALLWKGEGNLSDETYNQLKKQIEDLYSGKSNNGRPLLLDNLEWVQFSLSPKDMDFIAAKDTTAKDIARAFGVPPILLNIGSDTTFANQAEARLALWEDTVIPIMGSFIAELNTWLVPRYGEDLEIVADLSKVSALEIKREKQWERAKTADFLTVNEKRALVGYEEIEGGDDVLIQSTLIPLTFEMPDTQEDEEKELRLLEVKQTFGDYPQSASNNAKRALDYKEKNGSSCGTPVGWARANQLASRESLSLETVKRTYSFLSRAETYYDGGSLDKCGNIMYLAWGGLSMKRWCKSTLDEIEGEKSQPDGMEFKLLDGSRRAEKREQAIQDRLMATLERPFSAKINTILLKWVDKVAREWDIGYSVEAGLIGMNDELQKAYAPHYKRTGEIFGKRTLDGLKAMDGHILETKQEEDIFRTALDAWIDENAAARVVLVSETTKGLIRDAVVAGIADSLTGGEMASLIREKAGGQIARNRSVTIARTETHAAAQAASMAAVDATGLEVRKVWISAEDERTRETHIAVDASSHEDPLLKDEAFQVGGDTMQAPGLGSDPAQNVNCRCVVAWKSPE